MNKNILETLTGFVVLLIAVGFIYVSYKGASIQTGDGYTLNANFDRVDGLGSGADVRISGIKIGTVVEQKINPETYAANVTVKVRDDIKIPNDSSAEIVSDGLLGGKYFAIVPGGSDTMFKAGDSIKYTQSSISIEQLIGKFIFNGEDKDDKKTQASSKGAKSEKSADDIF